MASNIFKKRQDVQKNIPVSEPNSKDPPFDGLPMKNPEEKVNENEKDKEKEKDKEEEEEVEDLQKKMQENPILIMRKPDYFSYIETEQSKYLVIFSFLIFKCFSFRNHLNSLVFSSRHQNL